MQFEEFMAEVKKQAEMKYPGVDVEVLESNKNNGVLLHGLAIRENKLISPTIYLEKYYEDYTNGVEFDEIMEIIIDKYEKSKDVKIEAIKDQGWMLDYEKVKGKIYLETVNYEENRYFLSNVPYKKEADLALVPRICIEKAEDGIASTLVTNDMFVKYNIGKKEFIQQALDNTQKMFPVRIEALGSMLQMAFGMDMPMPEEKSGLYVVTNDLGTHGATALFYPDTIKKVREAMGTEEDLIMMPSSIHEVLLIIKGDNDPQALRELVNEVNQTAVSPMDFLSNNVYEIKGDSIKLVEGIEKKREQQR